MIDSAPAGDPRLTAPTRNGGAITDDTIITPPRQSPTTRPIWGTDADPLYQEVKSVVDAMTANPTAPVISNPSRR